jgi:uncharacterized protein
MIYNEIKPEKSFIGRLSHNQDMITSIEKFCVQNHIEMGWFSLIGAVSSVTLGYYDQKQMVYVTSKTDEHLEIASCSGNISQKNDQIFVHAHAVLTNEKGQAIGGHIFSETIIFAGEIYIQTFSGKPLNREHDNLTGLMLWNMHNP